MLIYVDQLNHEQLAALDLLSTQCKITDQNTIPIYKNLLNQPRILPCVLYYPDTQLKGFLGPFFFYKDAVEISLMIDPSCRKKGVAKQLLNQIIPLIEQFDVNKLIFSAAKGLYDDWLLSQGFNYQSSEYEMRRLQPTLVKTSNPVLSIRLASQDDITYLAAIDNAAFPNQHENMHTRILSILDNPSYNIFIATLNNVAIGKVHVKWEAHGARFSDIAILPEYQGHGFGRMMLAHCINHAVLAAKSNLFLDVHTDNQKALNLYTKLGFSINNAWDYWSVSLNTLRQYA